VSLERLETIGDSFLKYCATMHIYCNFPDYNEGQMTTVRGRLVSNAALCTAGKKKEIGQVLSGGIFIPLTSWLPTGFVVSEHISKIAIEHDSNFQLFSKIPVDKLKVGAM
jgi:endoribonuclease Dicer